MIFLKKQSNTSDSVESLKHIDIEGILPELLSPPMSLFTQMATGEWQQDNLSPYNNKQSSNKQLSNKQANNKQQTSWSKRLIAMPAYHWVLLSQLVVMLPHLAYMPVWLVGYGLFSVAMQLPQIKQKFAQHRRLKSFYRFIQLLGFVLGVGGLWFSFGGFNVETGVAFLLLCLASKLWEMYQRRDAFVVLNLSLFVCAALFLLDQGLASTMQALLAVLSVLMAFVVMNDDADASPESSSSGHSAISPVTDVVTGEGRIRSVAILAGFAVPLLVVLFLFFPRLPPLWSLKLSSPQAKTGMSDSMSPGDFANLSQSTELAFRVEFAGDKPILSNMYWRGLVFSDFDGVTWTANRQFSHRYWLSSQAKPDWVLEAEKSSQQAIENYHVILEPTNQQWLFALDYPHTLQDKMALTTDFTLTTLEPVFQQKRYQSSYQPEVKIGLTLTEAERTINLALPSTGNQQARQLAKQLYAQSGSTQAYLNAIQQWIYQGNFRYTLSPPLLGDNRIDDFLFNTQAGFCEHYSSSFTFLMRAAGIPARVVVGYQGGQLGRDGTSWEIRQMDAHAWAEVWLEGQGWVRVDPTSWIAPERVEQGMDALSNTQGASLFGDGAFAQLSYQQYKMLQELRRLSDQMSYYWDRDIVGYDQNSQSNSLLKWFNIKNVVEQIMYLVAVFVVVMASIVLLLWFRRRQQWHIADRQLLKLSRQLAKVDEELAKSEDEGMLAWIGRLQADEDLISEQQNLEDIKHRYRKLRYGRLSKIGFDDSGKPTTVYRTALNAMNQAVAEFAGKL